MLIVVDTKIQETKMDCAFYWDWGNKNRHRIFVRETSWNISYGRSEINWGFNLKMNGLLREMCCVDGKRLQWSQDRMALATSTFLAALRFRQLLRSALN